MLYHEITPEELFAAGFTDSSVTERPWVVRWDRFHGDPRELVLAALPDIVGFDTSGTTGASRTWSRRKEFLWAEAGMLAGLLAPRGAEAVLSFVHPTHLYGALASFLVPAHLRLPVWYRPGFAGEMPSVEHRRWAVMAIPWIFSLLRRHADWVARLDEVTVLHASGMIPDAAHAWLTETGADRARIIEVFGATESGGVATRQWSQGTPPDWRLLDDVVYASPPRPGEGEVPLVVRSPRLAFLGDASSGEEEPGCELDDHVERLDDRSFRFTGRRSRLVNINGRRYNLDRLEDLASGVLDCADLALRPVADPMIGEHVELVVVLRPGTGMADLDLATAFTRMGVRPRRVRDVDHIDRTEIGKFRRVADPVPTDAGAPT